MINIYHDNYTISIMFLIFQIMNSKKHNESQKTPQIIFSIYTYKFY